mmetsp:Transcript_42646/g.114174  ORF Transcript_42646/g.114174 Transcript_42646/m.114174 type:complete len:292 (+) Transcript_42646:181-1056(+)
MVFDLKDRGQLDLNLAHVALKLEAHVDIAVARARRPASEAVLDAHDLEPPLSLELFDCAPHPAHLGHRGDYEGRSQVVLHHRGDPVVVQSNLLSRALFTLRVREDCHCVTSRIGGVSEHIQHLAPEEFKQLLRLLNVIRYILVPVLLQVRVAQRLWPQLVGARLDALCALSVRSFVFLLEHSIHRLQAAHRVVHGAADDDEESRIAREPRVAEHEVRGEANAARKRAHDDDDHSPVARLEGGHHEREAKEHALERHQLRLLRAFREFTQQRLVLFRPRHVHGEDPGCPGGC